MMRGKTPDELVNSVMNFGLSSESPLKWTEELILIEFNPFQRVLHH